MLWKKDPIRRRNLFPLLQILKEAVAYRIPRTVIKAIRYGQGAVYPVCPRCDSGLEREYSAFCDRCGQRLGWYALEFARVVDSDTEKLSAKSEETGKNMRIWLRRYGVF